MIRNLRNRLGDFIDWLALLPARGVAWVAEQAGEDDLAERARGYIRGYRGD